MAVYKRGSQGEEVRIIQNKLKDLGFYQGPIDREVHHTPYDLEEQYGITLKPYEKK